MIFSSSADIFKIDFFKNSFRNTIRVSNSLDPHQDRLSFGPNLIWVQTFCKGCQQTTKVGFSKERVREIAGKFALAISVLTMKELIGLHQRCMILPEAISIESSGTLNIQFAVPFI